MAFSTELVPCIPGRPGVVQVDGWTCYVGIRDAEYMRLNREWRQRLASSHPDKGGSSNKFRNLMQRYRTWKLGERHLYWDLGLMPPDWKGPSTPPPANRPTMPIRRSLRC